MRDDFIIFIITNNRPNDVITLKTLQDLKCQYPIYFVLDNQDESADQYRANFGDSFIKIFDKEAYAKKVDQYDNFHNLRTTTHARNACFDIAEELGKKYFLVLDDDYTQFLFRVNGDREHPTNNYKVKQNIDFIFEKTLEYFISSNFTSICYSQGGDWFGGHNSFYKKPKRKAMNSFFCSTERRFWFESRLNEDVNTYMTLGKTGNVFMTIPYIQLNQKQTQQTAGGMTDAYVDGGTYVKSFYTIITRPDCTSISQMGMKHKRLHHHINWKYAVPYIIPETYKK